MVVPAPTHLTVSVLMAVYAGEKPRYLREALQSIAEQSLQPDEVVVVKDGPLTSDLERVLNSGVLGSRLKVVALASNNGLASALNHGLSHCTGDIIVRLDSDDIAVRTRIELQARRFMDDPRTDILGGFAVEIDANGDHGILWRRPLSDDAIKRSLWTNPIIHPSVAFRRSPIESLGGYDIGRSRAEDHDLWVRAAAANMHFANLDAVLIFYRVDDEASNKLTWDAAWERFTVAERSVTVLRLPFWLRIPPLMHLVKAILPKRARKKMFGYIRTIDPRHRPG